MVASLSVSVEKSRGSKCKRELKLHCSSIPEEIFLGKVFQWLDGVGVGVGGNVLELG